jgi:hypothetical protein
MEAEVLNFSEVVFLALIRLSYVINPSGSQNLELDFSK